MRIMRLIAIVAVVLALVGIAYIRALYSNQERVEMIDSEISEQINMDDFVAKVDAYAMIDSVRIHYIDSLAALMAADSMETMTDASGIAVQESLHTEIKVLSDSMTTLKERISQLRMQHEISRDKLVYSYFTNEIALLPTDLSDYEMKVSVKEIKSKAKKYFDLSGTELESIIKKHQKK